MLFALVHVGHVVRNEILFAIRNSEVSGTKHRRLFVQVLAKISDSIEFAQDNIERGFVEDVDEWT